MRRAPRAGPFVIQSMIARPAAKIFSRSDAASRPARRRMMAFGSVKSLKRTTHGRGNPAASRSAIATSLGHVVRLAVVIIAQIECSFARLNVSWERMSEGRRFSAATSTKGNGNITMSPRSQITERLVVLRRIPFRHRLTEGFQVAVGGACCGDANNLAAPRLEALPDFSHGTDRLDRLGRPAVFARLAGHRPQRRGIPHRHDVGPGCTRHTGRSRSSTARCCRR